MTLKVPHPPSGWVCPSPHTPSPSIWRSASTLSLPSALSEPKPRLQLPLLAWKYALMWIACLMYFKNLALWSCPKWSQRTAHRFLKLGFQSRATFYPHFIWMSSIFVLFILFLKNEVERIISSWWKLFNHEQDTILSMGNTQVNKARPFSSRLVIQQIDSC